MLSLKTAPARFFRDRLRKYLPIELDVTLMYAPACEMASGRHSSSFRSWVASAISLSWIFLFIALSRRANALLSIAVVTSTARWGLTRLSPTRLSRLVQRTEPLGPLGCSHAGLFSLHLTAFRHKTGQGCQHCQPRGTSVVQSRFGRERLGGGCGRPMCWECQASSR